MGRTGRVVSSVFEALKSLEQALEDPSAILLSGETQPNKPLAISCHCPADHCAPQKRRARRSVSGQALLTFSTRKAAYAN